ncbi:MAG: hypothetical protein HKN76_05140 [Saprospiraceae bacterium]|nr:hypothetical protein [Saprospiraceae bacterium]
MKYLHLTVLIVFALQVTAQPTGWNVDNVFHVSFKYNDGGAEHESSHWQPGGVMFWKDNTYQTSSAMQSEKFMLLQPNKNATVDIQSLVFQNNNAGSFVDRVRLDYDGLDVVNGASWRSLQAHINGNSGQLDLYTGVNGNRIASLGSTAMNSNLGALRLYSSDGNTRWYSATSADDYGYSVAYGDNGNWNSYIGTSASQHNHGYMSVHDASGTLQAGMYVNPAGQGVIFADVKNFRISNPLEEDSEIWYASLEGPEAGAYERGTATLVDGEAFVPYSDHFKVVANTATMTVNITALEWDTYGLAVIEKANNGFWVKELKGGTGNFSFDWEVKCARAGKEDYQVFRKPESLPNFMESIETEEVPQSKVQGVKQNLSPGIETHHNCASTERH